MRCKDSRVETWQKLAKYRSLQVSRENRYQQPIMFREAAALASIAHIRGFEAFSRVRWQVSKCSEG